MRVQIHDLKPVLSETEMLALREHQAQRQQRQAAQSMQRRGLVLEAARRVFAERGLDGASIREIARRAGYTAGAIYSYFDSKEAIHVALLGESLERLRLAMEAPRVPRGQHRAALEARARAWFAFYVAHPQDLDLALLRTHGPEGGAQSALLDARVLEVMRPCEQALLSLGLDQEAAVQERTSLLAYGLGLLVLRQVGLPGGEPQAQILFDRYLAQLLERVGPAMPPATPEAEQGDLFDL